MKLSLGIILSVVLLLQIVQAGRYGYAGRAKGKAGGGGNRYNPNAQYRYRGGAGAGGGMSDASQEQLNDAETRQEDELRIEEKKLEDENNPPKLCLLSSGFLAPINTGAPLGLRVKRDTDLPPERGLFVVIAIESGSPSATTLHVGDTITTVNGYSTKDMTVAQFSQAINEARQTGVGYVSMTFYTKHCPAPPRTAESSSASQAASASSSPENTPISNNKDDASTTQQKVEDTSAKSSVRQTEKDEDDEDEDEEEDDEDDEDEDEEDEEDFNNGRLNGEYSVVLQNFQPPLGLRVTQEGKHLVVVGVIAKPEVWTMVKVGDILSSIQNERPRSTIELKETVLSQAGKAQVTVKLLRQIPKANKDGSSGGMKVDQQHMPTAEEGPRLSFVLKRDRKKPLGLRLASLASTGSADDGFLGVVDAKGHEYIQPGDRLRFVGGLLVMTPLDVSDALRGDKNDEDDDDSLIELEFIRGVPGTLEDLRLLKKLLSDGTTTKTTTTHPVITGKEDQASAKETDAAVNPIVPKTDDVAKKNEVPKTEEDGQTQQIKSSFEDITKSKSTEKNEDDYSEDDEDYEEEDDDEKEAPQINIINNNKDSIVTKPEDSLKADHTKEPANEVVKEPTNVDNTNDVKKEEKTITSKDPSHEARLEQQQNQQKSNLVKEQPSAETAKKEELNDISNNKELLESDLVDPEEEAARLEILRQVKEAEEIKAKADAALKELERKRLEERERRALLKKKQEEEEAERRRKEQEEKERQQMCAAEAVIQQQKLEESIYQVLKDDNFLREMAKRIAERAYQP